MSRTAVQSGAAAVTNADYLERLTRCAQYLQTQLSQLDTFNCKLNALLAAPADRPMLDTFRAFRRTKFQKDQDCPAAVTQERVLRLGRRILQLRAQLRLKKREIESIEQLDARPASSPQPSSRQTVQRRQNSLLERRARLEALRGELQALRQENQHLKQRSRQSMLRWSGRSAAADQANDDVQLPMGDTAQADNIQLSRVITEQLQAEEE